MSPACFEDVLRNQTSVFEMRDERRVFVFAQHLVEKPLAGGPLRFQRAGLAAAGIHRKP